MNYGQYLVHGKEWAKHKYIKKAAAKGYTRYYYNDSSKNAEDDDDSRYQWEGYGYTKEWHNKTYDEQLKIYNNALMEYFGVKNEDEFNKKYSNANEDELKKKYEKFQKAFGGYLRNGVYASNKTQVSLTDVRTGKKVFEYDSDKNKVNPTLSAKNVIDNMGTLMAKSAMNGLAEKEIKKNKSVAIKHSDSDHNTLLGKAFIIEKYSD